MQTKGFANGFTARPGSPVRAVSVEEAAGDAGERVARVRLSLEGPLTPRVRSQRNLIFVEVDAAAGGVAPAAASGTPADAVSLRSVRTEIGRDGVSLLLAGTGSLVPSSVRTTGSPQRLVLDFPNVVPAVPTVTTVRQGPVERVRVALNSRDPLVTRVVVDLARAAEHTLVPGADGTSLRLTFPDNGPTEPAHAPVGDAMTALTTAQAPRPLPPPPPSTASETAEPSPEPAPRTVAPTTPPTAAVTTPPAAAKPPAAPAPLQAGQTSTVSRSGEKTYSGHPVSLDFQGADLRAVLRTFAEISGLNMVIDPAVQGSVDVALRDVPWDQALDIILRANKLGYFVDGTIVRVAPLTVLAEEEKQRRKLTEEQALSGEIRVLTRTLSYAKAEDVKPLLIKSALSQRGTVRVRPAHQHAHHVRPRHRARNGVEPDRHARQAAAAGRNRSADRPDDERFRADHRRAVGIQRPRVVRNSGTRRDSPSRTTDRSRVARGRRRRMARRAP